MRNFDHAVVAAGVNRSIDSLLEQRIPRPSSLVRPLNSVRQPAHLTASVSSVHESRLTLFVVGASTMVLGGLLTLSILAGYHAPTLF